MKRIYLSMVIVAAILAGCTEAPQTEDFQSPQDDMAYAPTPYELEFMQQVMPEFVTRSSELQPTHLYVEFSPRTAEQYDRLLAQTAFECLPFSVLEQYELPEGEEFCTVENTDNRLYALVTTNDALPDDITYTVLKSYYTPYADAQIDRATANRIAARAAELSGENERDATRVSVMPGGTVKVFDELATAAKPVEGVPVTIIPYSTGVGFHPSETVYTNSAGVFRATHMDLEGVAVSYRISWDTQYWTIKNDAGSVAVINGPTNTTSDWNFMPYYMDMDKKPYYYICAHRALQHTSKNGISIPLYRVGANAYKLSVTCRNEVTPSGKEESLLTITNQVPAINMYCKNKKGAEIVAMTNYEIGRIGLYNNNKAGYSNISLTVRDSWGMFTRSYFTDSEYARIGSLAYLHRYVDGEAKPDAYNIQAWNYNDSSHEKTPLFIDIYDSYNNTRPGIVWFDNVVPNDNIAISNFSIIKDIAFSSTTIPNVRNKLNNSTYQNNYGYTAADVNKLFLTYNKLSSTLTPVTPSGE